MKNGRYEEYGRVCWYVNDELHREDGPAIEYPDGRKEFYLHDMEFNQDHYEFIINPPPLSTSTKKKKRKI